MALPTTITATPVVQPLTGGLYSAVSPVDGANARVVGGLSLEPTNTGISGQWEHGAEDNADKVGDRPEFRDFVATTVWAGDTVSAVGATLEGSAQRAEHILTIREPVEVEAFVAAQFAEFPVTGSAPTAKEQLGIIEDELGKYGRPGVIHASRAIMVHLPIVRQGSALFSPGGHRYAFGGGYSALGTDIVATGPMVIERSPVYLARSTEVRQNEYSAVAERVVAVGWELPDIRVTRSVGGE